MMMRRTQLRARPPQRQARPDRSAEFASFTAARPLATMAANLAAGPVLAAPKKPEPLRDESYRRLVASLPCMHCGRAAASQCAHQNAGKAKGDKVDDRMSFPLCHVGARGCHDAFDQYRLVQGGRAAHIALGMAYTASTHAALRALAQHDTSARTVIERTIGL